MHTATDSVYDIHGPKDGPPVVLIHGLGLTRAVWDGLIPALSDRYRVLAHDLLGHGQTPAPQATPTLKMLADQVSGLMGAAGVERAALVGFSLGGMIARRFAQDHPARTRALAILNSPHRRSPQAQAGVEARVAQARLHGPAATVEDALARWFTEPFRLANPQVMERVRGWVLGNDPATYPEFYRIFALGVDEVVAPTPAISCPTLVMAADQDQGNSPDMARAIAADIPGARMHILPGLRHMALMEDSAAMNRAVRSFLDHVHHTG